jgi:hypothetical protein
MRPVPIFGTEANLPRHLGSLNYEAVEVYPDSRPGVGIRYADRRRGIKADCSLCDLGRKDLPSDLQSAPVVELFRRACNDVCEAGRRGWYLDLELRPAQHLHLAGEDSQLLFLLASFSYRQAGGPDIHFTGPRISHLALRVDRGLINQVRYTYRQGPHDEQSYQGCLNFLQDWLNAVRTRQDGQAG